MKRQHLKQKLLSNARAIIANEVSIPMGCIRMSKIISWLGQETENRYPIFASYMERVNDLPLAQERLQWNKEALLEEDRKLEAINQQFREKILTTCFDIINKNSA